MRFKLTIILIMLMIISFASSLKADDDILQYPYRQTFRNPFIFEEKKRVSKIKKAISNPHKGKLKINLPFKVLAIIGNKKRRVAVVINNQGDYIMLQGGNKIEEFTIKNIFSENVVVIYKNKLFNVSPGSDIGEIDN